MTLTKQSASASRRRRPGSGGRLVSTALTIAMLTACATEPPTVFHTLLPLERPAPSARAAGPLVRVESVRVPDAVDQPQWLIRVPDGTLVQLERERWASPPSNEIAQALREHLRLRFNMSDAVPTGSQEGWRLRVDVLRFESLPDEARLDAAWSIAGPGTTAPVVLRCTSYFRQAASGGMATLGDAHRRNVAALGSLIGQELLDLNRGEAPACPKGQALSER